MLIERAELPLKDDETLADFARKSIREFVASGFDCAKVNLEELKCVSKYRESAVKSSFYRAAKNRKGVRAVTHGKEVYLIRTDKRKKA